MKWRIVIIDNLLNKELKSDLMSLDEAYADVITYMKPSMFGTDRYKIYLEPVRGN